MLSRTFNHKDITIRLISSLAEWESLSSEWDNLLAATKNASIFNAHYFLTSWWKSRKLNFEKLMILLMHDRQGDLVGIAPLLYGWYMQLCFPLRTVSFMYDDSFMDRPQFIFPNQKDELMEALFQYFLWNRKNWDTIELTEQVVGASYKDILSRSFQDASEYRIDVLRQSFAPFLIFDSEKKTWDNYLTTRTKKHRKKWRYLNNRINKIGKIRVTRHENSDDLSTAFDHFKAIEKKSWKKNTDAKISNWHYKFYKQFNKASDQENKILCVLLWLEDQPIAGIIGLKTSRNYAALHTSFDRAYGKFSPGFLISGFDIQWAIENGIYEYDLMSGWPSDKLQWTDTMRETSFVRVIQKRAYAGLFNFIKFSINNKILDIEKKIGLRRYLEKRKERKQPPMNKSRFAKHNQKIGEISEN